MTTLSLQSVFYPDTLGLGEIASIGGKVLGGLKEMSVEY